MSLTWSARLQPRYIPSTVLLIIETVLLLEVLARGTDYLGGIEPSVSVVPMANAIVSMHTWGILYMVGGVILAVGIVFWRHLLTWAGHAYLTVIHAGFLIGAIQVTAPAGEWRWPALFLIPTVMHLLLAVQLGPVPTRRP